MHPAPVTLQDVANEADVHVSTASRALDPANASRVREATRLRIQEAAARLGYRPHMIARGLQSGRTATVAFVAADLGNTFVTPIIHGVAGAIASDGMMPIIAETEDDHHQLTSILDHMLSRRVDAVVVAAARDGDREILEATARIVPVVIAARPLEGSDLPAVVHDDRTGGQIVAQHLADSGHRRVAQLAGPPDVANFPRRAHGFSEEAGRLGLEEIQLSVRAERPVVAEGERLVEALLADIDVLPTALFAHNDLIALGALSALRREGISVPDQVSLVGYNDLPMVEHLTPALTTVRYPSLEIGEEAGRLILDLLAGKTPDSICLPPRLIVRSSVVPPPANSTRQPNP